MVFAELLPAKHHVLWYSISSSQKGDSTLTILNRILLVTPSCGMMLAYTGTIWG
jgi:hypothetical protein